MLEQSTQAINKFIATLEQRRKENTQVLQKKQPIAKETIARNQKLIDDSKTPPIERLRALIMNVLESDDILLLHREQASLLQSSLFANCVRMFQEEAAYELNMLNAKIAFQRARETPKGEEPEKYAKIEEQLQTIKHMIDEEWKPMMDRLREEIDKRDRFLNKNR
jgi:hypothetical protein